MLTLLFKRVGMVAVGTGLGQGLVLLATPFLARVYSPADFGTLALLLTVSNISMAVACARYDLALPSAEAKDERGLLIASMVIALCLGATLVTVFLLLSTNREAGLRAGELLAHPGLVGACVISVGTYQATSAWLLRRGRYAGVAAMRVSQGGTFGALAAIPGVGLLWAHAASFSGGVYGVWQALRKKGPEDATWTAAARSYRKFPLLSLPGAILDVVGYSICIWTVASFYGRDAAGEYSQVQRLIGAPLMLVSISLGQILLKQTADLMHDRPQMRLLLVRLLKLMAAGAMAALVFLAIAGKPVLALILGPKWHLDREMIVALGAAVFVRACVSPMSSVLLTLRRFSLALAWQAAYFVSAVTLMPFMANRVPFHLYVRFYAVHELVLYSTYLVLILFALRDERPVPL